MAENDRIEGGSAAPVDNSPSLVSVIGEMYGDYRDAEPESDAGAPPAETPEGTATDSEGPAASEAAAEPAATPDAESDLDSSAPPVDTDLDPLEGSQPFAYQVDKEARTFEGITVLKDGTAIIDDPNAVQRLQRVIGERDHLFSKDQESYRKYSDLERLSAWQRQTGKDGNGQPVYETLTGRDAVEASRVALSDAIASNIELRAALQDPETIASLIAGVDEAGNIVLHPGGIRNLETRIENARLKAVNSTRAYFAKVAAQPAPAPPEAPAAAHAMPTIETFARDYGVAGLTAEDKQTLAGQFDLYVRATPNGRVVDPRFLDLMKHTAATRAQTTSIATTASTAARSNAAKLAAAKVGGKQTNAPRINTPKEPERTRADDFEDLWDKQEKAAAGALKAHALGR